MSIPFNEKELKVVSEIPNYFTGGSTPVYDFPLKRKDGYKALIEKKPVWQVTNVETSMFAPRIYPDNVARALVVEASPLAPEEMIGGKDIFGIDWVYIPSARGSIVEPGSPILEDANEWREKIVFPDVDSWDWEGSAEANKEYLASQETFTLVWIQNGFFERLISFMDFEGAAIALIDEEQKDAVQELLDNIASLYIKILDKFMDHYGVKGFTIHDDWGAQKDAFFSPEVCREMIVPAMKRVTDHLHSRGAIADFHSCGMIEKQLPNMIAAGWDSWSGMPMNDTHALYEQYGDQIILGVIPEMFPEDASEEEQKKYAREFTEKFSNPEKPCLVNYYGVSVLTKAYREELYRTSRQKFSSLQNA